jgi:hypothetical protein
VMFGLFNDGHIVFLFFVIIPFIFSSNLIGGLLLFNLCCVELSLRVDLMVFYKGLGVVLDHQVLIYWSLFLMSGLSFFIMILSHNISFAITSKPSLLTHKINLWWGCLLHNFWLITGVNLGGGPFGLVHLLKSVKKRCISLLLDDLIEVFRDCLFDVCHSEDLFSL